MKALVSTAWLAERLNDPNLRVADASWYMPQAGRDAKAEYAAAHIPGAVFFDIDDLSDETTSLPHMLAPPAKFAGRMSRLGLGDGNMIVVYDGAGIFSPGGCCARWAIAKWQCLMADCRNGAAKDTPSTIAPCSLRRRSSRRSRMPQSSVLFHR